MSTLLHLAAAVYLIGTIFLVLFVSSFGILLMIYLRKRHQRPHLPVVLDDELPSVTIQLPIYNEPRVTDRLLDACANLDYPRHKLHIQILDDSTDETTALIRHKVAALKSDTSLHISHTHRRNRKGYKAGALQYGLHHTPTDCIAIFDADFVPPADFLRQTMPHFQQNPRLGLVQTRWSHLNAYDNPLTRAQALSIDAHFVVEQIARSRGNLPMSMNGSGGIWRVKAVHDAGGWQSDTLTEDLDLSYRAYLRGWEFLYLPEVTVPAELPPLVQAYKTQQARWATGSTQCLIKHLPALLMSPRLTMLQKLMGVMHLAQYIVQPVILMLFLLTPVLIWGGMFQRLPDLRLIAPLGIIPPVIIALAQVELYPDWPKRLLYFPVQFIMGIAIVLSNSKAVASALVPRKNMEFKRTPKFRMTHQASDWLSVEYVNRLDNTTIGELLMAVYALLGLHMSLQRIPAAAPYMMMYAVSFALFAVWNLYQSWTLKALTYLPRPNR